jgi:hypothetical protein
MTNSRKLTANDVEEAKRQWYLAEFTRRGGKCDVCGRQFKVLCVDYWYKTNKVRGLLCQTCNAGIGFLLDDMSIVKKAAVYLEKFYGNRIEVGQ